MNKEQWEKLNELFGRAQELPSDERDRFLEAECAGDAELLKEARRLLDAQPPEVFVEPPPGASIDHPVEEVLAGREFGDYRLMREIGRGGMGVVYLASQLSLDRDVAVKILNKTLTTPARAIERFHREARSAAKLAHPGIVPVYADGEQDGYHYFAMEYVPGGSLADELDAQRGRAPIGYERRLPGPGDPEHVATVALLVAGAAEALQHAHARGVVHRDIKPQNLMLGPGGAPRLVDFGLAKDESLGSLSKTGEILGTPHYMSPEQATARRTHIDHRTDVYSLGVVLYELLTLSPPFKGRSVHEVISKITSQEAAAVRKANRRVPRDLELVCAKAMEKNPKDRYETAGEFAADLRRFLAFDAVLASAPGLLSRVRRTALRHKKALFAGIVFVSGATLGAWAIGEVRAASEIERRLTPLREALAEADWDSLDRAELAATAREAHSFEAGAGPAGPESRRYAGDLLVRLRGYAETLKGRGETSLRAALSVSDPAVLGGIDDARILAALVDLQDAVLLQAAAGEEPSPLDPKLLYPEVNLSAFDGGTPPGPLPARVSYRELGQLDGAPGPLVELGTLDANGMRARLRPGYYRFVFGAENEFRELTRLVVRGGAGLDVRCVLREEPDRLDGMVAVAAGELALPTGDPLCYNVGRRFPVRAFRMDAAEVSITEYRRFLSETGRPQPPAWQFLPQDASVDRRPAFAVSWFDARAYAEWAGKRLPSHIEWEFAACGGSASFLPTPAAGGDPAYFGAVNGPEFRAGVDRMRSNVDAFLAGTLAVDDPSALDDRGFYHLLGNVTEWTESLSVERTSSGEFSPRPADRCLLGCAWYAQRRQYDLSVHEKAGPEPSYAAVIRGFRCCVSLQP